MIGGPTCVREGKPESSVVWKVRVGRPRSTGAVLGAHSGKAGSGSWSGSGSHWERPPGKRSRAWESGQFSSLFCSSLLFPPPPPLPLSRPPTTHPPLVPPPSSLAPSPAPERLWEGEVLGKGLSTRKGRPWGVGSHEGSRGGLPFPRHVHRQRGVTGHTGTAAVCRPRCLAGAERGMALGDIQEMFSSGRMRDTCRTQRTWFLVSVGLGEAQPED